MKMKIKSTKKLGRPMPVIYHLFFWLSAMYIRLRGVKITVDRSGLKGLKGPALLLCPHISLKDHIIVGYALLPHRLTFILSEHFISIPVLGKILKNWGHIITKKMFCSDVSTIVGIMRAKKENNIIVMFPEGRLNAVAHSQPVADGTAELVKKLGIDVYSVVGNGAALVFPKWGEKYRRGRIDIKSYKLLDTAEISRMTVADISNTIDRAIYHDDEKAMAGVRYRCSDTSKGLETILYKCPECMGESCITTGGGKIKCSMCGFETTLSDDYRLDYEKLKSVNEWFYWQKDQLDLNAVLSDDVKIGTVGEDGIMDFNAGKGHITLDREKIFLNGELYGSPLQFSIKTSSIAGMPYTPFREFDIYYQKKLLYIMPVDKNQIVKYVTMVDRLTEERKKAASGL